MKPLSVIIPALNEENYLGATLQRLAAAAEVLQSSHHCPVQVIVVDNQSTDQTASIARGLGAIVVPEPVRNIARARNAGARVAEGEVLFFLDADTLVPASVLTRVATVMSDPSCVGGAVDVQHRPARALLRLYVRAWRVLGRLTGMAQGAAQFWRRETFFALGGYDETMYMGEDVDFYWRMSRAAEKAGQKVCYVWDVQVVPSPRRYDQWPLWKTLWWTNPLLAALRCRHKRTWRGWYEDVPR
ncbi:MAG: glycosyltransferase [Limisphaerales bacterium]